ncbi:MAG: hypothetical protein PWR10_2124 [Halanaerobiales bacterium]|nr:hypothetical protein [Halanaerobiales bacterium]
MTSAILIIVLFVILALLMLTRKLPTLLAIPLMAIGIAIIAGIPLGGEQGILSNIIQGGVTRLATAYVAVIFGAWLSQIMTQTGISKSIIKFAAELGGDRPLLITLLLAIAIAILFTTIGGLGAFIMVGSIALPIMLSLGLPPVSAASIFLFAFGVGITINLGNWAFYVDATGVPLEVVKTFALSLAGVTAVLTFVFILIEFKKAGIRKHWVKPELNNQAEVRDEKVPKLALFTPIVPLLFVLVFNWPIVPSFIAGLIFAMITLHKSFAETVNIITKSAYDGISDVAPVIVLMMGIGMLLKTVFHPQVSAIMEPFLNAVIPSSTIGYILFFSLLAPLALYRGPLNMWGLGSGIVGLIISLGLLPAPAAMSALLATERVQAIGDPTNTHNVWLANYVGVSVNDILKKLLGYIWVLAAIGVIIAAVLYM